MSLLRQEKVNRVANYIPELEVEGDDESDVLVVSWGGTYGVMLTAVEELRKEGKSVSLAHFRNIMPLPKNTKEVLSRYKKIIVCEINLGQFVNYLRMTFPEFKFYQYNKIQGLPFMVNELKDQFNALLNE
jgi:2-oxoglutarate ferredoxin oxidoreductase subunit alpha